ncbi:MAG: tRNA (adenosine(37)-N6)-dimethylallyltransferase MiaA [Bacteroidales bacterium]|nr:tRNA (adenosine(37)-N6)-dimethylallyltransferase MiaA [Bacteroidales bacterium]
MALEQPNYDLKNTSLITVVGPTGVGKTALCLQIAKQLGCSIISCDSRQIYKEMHIGTAAPTPQELNTVKHYFIASRSINDNYNAGQYEIDALPIIESELRSKQCALFTGGSMLYVDAICKGIDNIPSIPDEIRNEVLSFYRTHEIEDVRQWLKLLDPVHYFNSDLRNTKRILHAIEICLTAEQPYSSLRTNTKKTRAFNFIKIGLERPREELYERINQRTEAMFEAGLETEARQLLPYRHLNALDTVGYKELFSFFDGEITKDEAIRLIKRNTRHYAKKQMTWFKHDTEIAWFHPEHKDEIIAYLLQQLEQNKQLA